MTIALSYLSDLSRVRVALSSLRDGTVVVERSATSGFQLPTTVRGASVLPIASGAGQVDDYEFYADVINYYRVRPVNPPAGLLLPGSSGDYASTPDAAALDITGDIDLRCEVTLDDWTPATINNLIAKYVTTSDQRSYRLYIHPTLGLRIAWSTDGTGPNTSALSPTVLPSPPASGRLAVRATLDVDDGASGHVATFYTAESIDGPWTQLGSPVPDAGTTSIFSSSAPLEVSGITGGTTELAAGVVHAVEVRNGIDGTVVADPDFAAQTDGAASFADGAGLTWTINGNASIVGPLLESGSITPSLVGEVWLKSVAYPSLNQVVKVSDYGDIALPSRSLALGIVGRSLPVGLSDLHGGRNHPLIVTTETPAQEAKLMLSLRAGGVWFVHVPTNPPTGREGNALLPGSMHVLVDTARIHRLGGVSQFQHFALPLLEVAEPPPEIVGTTLTWETVKRLYGSWTAVWAAHSTWRDVWDTIGDPSDVVSL